MAILIEKIKDEPIVVYHWPPKLESNQQIRDAMAADYDITHSLPDTAIWIIHDTSQLTIDFGTLVTSLFTLTREGPTRSDDPRFHIAAVSGSELIKLAARSAVQKQYGGWQVSIFDTYEQALAHAREDLAQRTQRNQ